MGCFSEYILKHDSRCLTCRHKIRLSRKRGGVEGLIDEAAWERIQAVYPKEVEARLAGKEFVDEEEERQRKEERLSRLQLAQAGEIKAEFDLQLKRNEEAREAQRRREEEESEKLIKELAGADAAVLVELERKQEQEQRDQEFARKLAEMDRQAELERQDREKQDAKLARKLSAAAEAKQSKRKIKAKRPSKASKKPVSTTQTESPDTPPKLTESGVSSSKTSKKKQKKNWLCKSCNSENTTKWLRCQVCSTHYNDS